MRRRATERPGTKKKKPCKECPKPRYGSSSLCRSHYFADARKRRDDAKARKATRLLRSKAGRRQVAKRLIKKLDVLFSKIIRSRGKCEKCGRRENLQCSHVYTRGNYAVRWNVLNATCLCAGCHLYWWHLYPKEAIDWLESVRTQEEMRELRRAANKIADISPETLAVMLSRLTSLKDTYDRSAKAP